jgi:hypothetical protein
MLLITNVFETRAYGLSSLKVILESSGSLTAYIKESQFQHFFIMKFTFHQKLIMIEHTHYLGQRSLHVIFWEVKVIQCIYGTLFEKKILFQQFKLIFDHNIYMHLLLGKSFSFQQFLNRNWSYSMESNNRLTDFKQSSLNAILIGHSEHTPSLWKKCSKHTLSIKQTFNDYCTCHSYLMQFGEHPSVFTDIFVLFLTYEFICP